MLKLSKVKDFYVSGLWTKSMVANAVVKGRITEAEYQEITGDTYTDPETQTDSVDLETRVAVMEDALQKLGAIE